MKFTSIIILIFVSSFLTNFSLMHCYSQSISDIGLENSLMYPVKSIAASPGGASLGLYNDNQVDLFTGKANISIPIYNLETGHYSLPISLSYNTGGFRVNEIASWIGLGWQLNAGGMITREVKGIPDEILYNGYHSNSGDILYNELIDGVLPYDDTDEFVSLLNVATGVMDGEPDIYNFTVGDLSGKFIFDKEGNIHLIGEHKNKIKITSTRDNITNPNYNSIKEFIITDDNGIKYYFGNNYTEKYRNSYSFIYYNTYDNYNNLINNYDYTKYYGGKFSRAWDNENLFYYISWYIYKIEFPDNIDGITFDYVSENNSFYSSTSETKYIGQRYSIAGDPINIDPSKPFCVKRINNYMVTNSQRLVKISYKDLSIDFIPEQFIREDINDPILNVRIGQAKALDSIKIYDNMGNNQVWKFQHSYFRPSATGEYSTYFKRLCLDKLSCGDQEWSFEYNSGNLPDRNSPDVDFWGFYKINTDPNAPAHMATPKIYLYTSDKDNAIYKSMYSIYPRSNYPGVEYILPGRSRTPSLAETKTYVLNKITFPTKGYKTFEYELNSFMLDNVKRVGPGLRILSITTSSGNSSPDIVENYIYEDENSNSYGLITDLPDFAYRNIDALEHGYANLFIDQTEKEDAKTNRINFSFNSIATVKGGYVGYTHVKKVIPGNGSTEYKFDYQPSYLTPGFEPFTRSTTRLESAWDELNYVPGYSPDYYFFNQQVRDRYPYFTPPDCGWNIGNLTEVIDRNSQGNIIKCQVNNYSAVENPNESDIYYVQANLYNYEKATLIVYYLKNSTDPPCDLSYSLGCYPYDVSLNDIIWGVNHYNTGYKRLNSTVSTTYDINGNNPISVTTEYKYDNSNFKYSTSIESSDSKGNMKKQNFYYPQDYTTSIPYIQGLVNNHILNKPLDSREYSNNRLINGTQIIYNSFGQATDYLNFESNVSDIPFNTGHPNTFSHKQSAIFDNDKKVLNEIQSDNDIPTSYLWGYHYSLPIAKIQNATFSSVITALNVSYDLLQSKSESELIIIFNNLRAALPNALITSYTYSPLLGKTTETDINGKTTYYKYDSNSRLKTIEDQDNKITNQFEYHYKEQ